MDRKTPAENVSNDTEFPVLTDSLLCSFAHYRPRVFARILRLPALVGSVLNWRTSSKYLLTHLLSLLDDERDFVDITNAALGQSLWPDLAQEAAKNKLRRWLARFDEDQYLSRFVAIERKRGLVKEEEGRAEFIPSRYKLGAFYSFAERVGEQMVNRNLLAVDSLRQRHAQHRGIVAAVLIDIGAVSILPGVRAQDEDKAKRKAKGSKAVTKGIEIDSAEFQRLPLKDQVDIMLQRMFDTSKAAFDLIVDMESYAEAEFLILKVLKYQAANAAAALQQRKQRGVQANLPGNQKREAVERLPANVFHRDRLVIDTLAAAQNQHAGLDKRMADNRRAKR